jgi:hypothetical protein
VGGWVGWLVGWWVGGLVGGWVGWFVGWLVDGWVGWLVGWWVGGLVGFSQCAGMSLPLSIHIVIKGSFFSSLQGIERYHGTFRSSTCVIDPLISCTHKMPQT